MWEIVACRDWRDLESSSHATSSRRTMDQLLLQGEELQKKIGVLFHLFRLMHWRRLIALSRYGQSIGHRLPVWETSPGLVAFLLFSCSEMWSCGQLYPFNSMTMTCLSFAPLSLSLVPGNVRSFSSPLDKKNTWNQVSIIVQHGHVTCIHDTNNIAILVRKVPWKWYCSLGWTQNFPAYLARKEKPVSHTLL